MCKEFDKFLKARYESRKPRKWHYLTLCFLKILLNLIYIYDRAKLEDDYARELQKMVRNAAQTSEIGYSSICSLY